MTETEIINYFSQSTVYKFSGNLNELHELQTYTSNSYNYLFVKDVIFFVARNEVNDPRAVVITGEV
jgi:hypothetical protein